MIEFVRLLDLYSEQYSEAVNIEALGDRELLELLEQTKEKESEEEFQVHLEHVASILVRFLIKAKDPEQQTLRVWWLLEESKTVDLFIDHAESDIFQEFWHYLDRYQPGLPL
jgi:hypothetical protein